MMKREKLKDELMKEIFPLETSQVLIAKAKKNIGKKRYDWLLNQFGPVKKGRSADLAEKGDFVFKISEVVKRLRATEDVLKFPTSWQLEGVKKTRRFRFRSFLFSVVVAFIFFLIGAIPFEFCKPLLIGIPLLYNTEPIIKFFLIKTLLLGIIVSIIWPFNCKIFSILERID